MTEGPLVRDGYILSRGFGANTRFGLRLSTKILNKLKIFLRQNLQHYLWKDEVGYLLHPSIPIDGENIRVADIGIGTGYGTRVHKLNRDRH